MHQTPASMQMSLEAQIQLITVPQEFTRLCNAVLSTEHGDDYLQIDDDRPDLGNDGYLKSEKRVFAVHCFKRAQNQSLDQAIRRKMVGDLGKAITLKNEGLWDIDAWTFLSNYPIDEESGRKVWKMGEEAGIDVSWRGPDYLAQVLHEHKSVRDQFPALQTNEISERLSELAEAVSESSAEAEATVAPPDRVPRTSDEKQALLVTRPAGWEYLLFASVLLKGKEDLEMKWHDHNMPPFRRTLVVSDAQDASAYLGDEFGNLQALVNAMMTVFSAEAQEQAFGVPGEPGDPVRIEHLAKRIIQTYEGILDWAAAIRGVEPPEVLRDVFGVAARMSDRPLTKFRQFVDRVVLEIDKVPALLDDPDAVEEPITIVLDLTLEMDDDVTAEFHQHMKRAKRKIKWGF
jgi:hypothetical protein